MWQGVEQDCDMSMCFKNSLHCCRAQPIDILTANLHLAEEFDVSAHEPYKVFNGLGLQDVQELHAAVCSMQVNTSTCPHSQQHVLIHSQYSSDSYLRMEIVHVLVRIVIVFVAGPALLDRRDIPTYLIVRIIMVHSRRNSQSCKGMGMPGGRFFRLVS